MIGYFHYASTDGEQLLELRAEMFLGLDYIDAEDEEAFESVEVDYDELLSVELERDKFKNVRATAQMLAHIIDNETKVVYPGVIRTRFEVRNGYKQAVKRGAALDEVMVFNLLFQLHQSKLKANGVALMTFGPQREEWIMLCPDNTKDRIRRETRGYLDVARRLVFSEQMDSNEQDRLITNLHQLTVPTRCANSLIHEYGHVLQYRMWGAAGIPVHGAAVPREEVEADIYEWFIENGYAQNISYRVPQFDNMSDEDKLLTLKEGFVEDYRIALNRQTLKGYYELPNAYCFLGDFLLPDLLNEGVGIVMDAIRDSKPKKVSGGFEASSREPERLDIINEIMKNGLGFRAGQSRMSTEDHKAVVERLRNKTRVHAI